ncbi:MAG: hypothetical protein JXX14_21140, partial [Deltaproteobacteria bacterium]|nr:hypothetical protein [Deltaproteobacteria bacterium]
MKVTPFIAVIVVLWNLTATMGCGRIGFESVRLDSETVDSESEDTESGDTVSGDTVSEDTVSGDTESGDTESGDTEPVDTESGDTESGDTESGDTESVDTVSGDTEPVDTEPVDTESVDTEPVDTEPVDTETIDTESVDTESVDTESVDTESVDTESVDTESVDTDTDTGVDTACPPVPDGTDLLSDTDMPDYSSYGPAAISLDIVSDGSDFTEAWHVESGTDNSNSTASQLQHAINNDITSGDHIVVEFWTRCVSAATGTCQTGMLIEESVDPWSRAAEYYP